MKKEIVRSINIVKMLDEARDKRVSVHLLIKRLVNYKRGFVKFEKCLTCQYSDSVLWPGEYERRLQCIWIGHEREKHADVDPGSVCDFYKRGFEYYRLSQDGKDPLIRVEPKGIEYENKNVAQ